MANSREAWDVADWRKAFIKHAVEAARLFGLAAARGLARAQCQLGLFYADGLGGLVKNDEEAVRLFRLAADQG